MEDIEDVITSRTPPGLRLPFTTVSMKHRRKPKPRLLQDPLSPSPQIPGTQTIYMKTFGCSHNQSDSEYMAGQLSAFGYALTDNPEEADLWLLNTCTVKSPSQSAMGTLILKSKTAKKPLVVAGCVPQGSRDLKELEGISLLGVQQIDRVVEVVEETLKGHEVRLLRRKTLPALDLPKVRKNTYVEILPINVGCLGACTYCKTKHARGHLGSYTVESLVERLRTVISDDVKEIWLSSEDTGAYGRDIGANLPMLLNALVAELPADGSIMFRIGMTNPPFILEHLEAIAKVLRHPCVYAFLHVPVQSGSDVVLNAMNREYTVSDFRTVVDTLMKLVPEMQIATDVICGFPGETDEDFAQTVALIKEYQFPQVHISQFYPRPGTPAARMKKVPTTEVKKRSRELTSTFESFNPYKHMVGQVERIWITEVATDGVHLVGHTKGYVQVLVTAPDSMLGTSTMVKITSVGRWSVFGEVIESPTVVEENSFSASSTMESPASTAFEKFCDCSSESECYLNVVKTGIENVNDGDDVEENSFPLSSTVEFPSSAAFENFCDGSSKSECYLHTQKSSGCKVEENSFQVSSPKESSCTAAFENLCKCSSNPECECYMSLKTRMQNVTSGHKTSSANILVDPSNNKNWLGRTLITSIKPDLLQRRIKGCERNSDDPLEKSVDRIDTPERRIRGDLSMTDGMLFGGVIVSLLTIAVLLTRLFSQMLSS